MGIATTPITLPVVPPPLGLEPGELVRVRSAAEIFATLDPDGTLDGLPFMPEMLKYCGRTLPVAQRADTTCAGDGVVRRMHDTVHLAATIRCDGSAHDGCQAACLMFWKEAWLERVANGNGAGHAAGSWTTADEAFVADTLASGHAATGTTDDGKTLYRCQATEIPKATEPLRFREVGQYVAGLRSWKLAEDPPRPVDRGCSTSGRRSATAISRGAS